jgi:hypothetical protein
MSDVFSSSVKPVQSAEPVRITCIMTVFGHNKDQCFIAPEDPNMRDVLLWRTTIYRSGLIDIPAEGT